jgi:outer membrane protein OmpA-like peptidoglycan-associated protein
MKLSLDLHCSKVEERNLMPGKVYIVFFITFFFLSLAFGLEAQMMEFEPVELLSNSINSKSEESMPILSPDGNQLFFTRTLYRLNTGGENAGQDIWVCHKKQDGTWTKANNNFPEWNNKYNNSIVGISTDGNTVYLLDSYQVEGQTKGLAFSRFVKGKWTKPERINIKGLDLSGYIGFYMNETYDVLLISMEGRDSMGEEDLYVSFLSDRGKWSKPKSLGSSINSAGYEISPFLDSDKRTLYFSSNGRMGYGEADIYVSQRLYDSWEVWSTPVNLGPEINSESFDAYLTKRDSTVYFVSSRGETMSDIYKTKIKGRSISQDQQQIQQLLSEAESLLTDLEDNKRAPVFFKFESKSSELTAKTIEKIERILETYTYQNLVLTSYCSEYNNEILDRDLALERAREIQKLLQEKGVSQEFINIRVTNNPADVSTGEEGVELTFQQ